MLPYIFIMNRPIPMYGLCIVVGVIFASIFAVSKCKKQGLTWEDVIVLGFCGIGVGFICAKLLYIFVTFTPNELINIVKSNELSELLNGGFVFYGGFAGGILGVLLGSKIAHTKISYYENILIMAIPIAHFWGRIGCLCAGCCYGKPSGTGFGITYKNPIGNTPLGVPLIPVQLYEALFNIVIFIVLCFIDKMCRKKHIVVASYLLMYAVGRFVLEFFRYDYVRGIYFGMSTSQLISVFFVVVALTLIIKNQKNSR